MHLSLERSYAFTRIRSLIRIRSILKMLRTITVSASEQANSRSTENPLFKRKSNRKNQSPLIHTRFYSPCAGSVFLHDHTSDTIHCPLHVSSHGIPIRPPLCKLVYLFCTEDAMISIVIRDNGREFLATCHSRCCSCRC